MNRWGEKVDILLAMKEQGAAVPALDNKPKLDESLLFDLNLFGEVQSARRYTYGSPLPLSDQEIFSFLCLHDLPDKLALVEQMKVVDRAWLHVQSEKQKRETKKTKTASSKSAKAR